MTRLFDRAGELQLREEQRMGLRLLRSDYEPGYQALWLQVVQTRTAVRSLARVPQVDEAAQVELRQRRQAYAVAYRRARSVYEQMEAAVLARLSEEQRTSLGRALRTPSSTDANMSPPGGTARPPSRRR